MRIWFAALTVALLLPPVFVPAVLGQTAPNASSAATRPPDGKPDFSGLWRVAPAAAPAARQLSVFQGGTAARRPTRIQLALQLPLTAKGKELVEQYTAADGEFSGETGAPGDPRYHTIPCGPASPGSLTGDVELVHNSKRLLMVYTGSETKWIRQVWIGRQHPKDLTDYEPVWMGHSVGRWEGNTLVIDTVAIKTSTGQMIDTATAAPQGPKFHLIERLSLFADGRLHLDKTFEDPDIYTRPWTKSAILAKQTNWDEIAEDWEIQDQHTVCEDAKYPSDNDPYFKDEKK
jgi:hypothetical protein